MFTPTNKKLTIVYRLGQSRGLSPAEVIRVHRAHADNPENGGRVLFTTGRGPAVDNRDFVKHLILMAPDGHVALFADVVAVGNGNVETRPEGYDQPSQWETKDKPHWFALDNLREGAIQRGEFTAAGGKDLLDAHGGAGPFVYLDNPDVE